MYSQSKIQQIITFHSIFRVRGYALNQTHYIEKVVSKFSHLKIKDANTSFDSSVKLEKNDGRAVAQLEYASAIGSLMYAAQCTKAEI